MKEAFKRVSVQVRSFNSSAVGFLSFARGIGGLVFS